MLTKSDINFLQNTIPFYNKLNVAEKENFNKHAFHTTFKSNQFSHITQKECSGLLVVLNGSLRAFLNSPDGKEITLYTLLDGDTCIFTASCIFNNINFNVNVEAISDTEVIVLPSHYLDFLQKNNIEFQKYILQVTQSKMSEVIWIIEQVVFSSFDKRLKDYLLNFNSNTITTTHNTIVKDLGTAREVVSRMLKHFEKEGIVKLSRGVIEIIDTEKIKDI